MVSELERQMAQGRAVDYWRAVIRKAISDCSTTDYYAISDGGVDNLALVAAQAVERELRSEN
jgi:predicted aminopeptidase